MNFVRTLWGTDGRRLKMNRDIQYVLKAKYSFDFITYVYGKDNFKQLTDLGFSCKLLSEEDRIYPSKQEFGHKINTWKEASKDYEKFVYLDWDVFLMRQLPNNFDELFIGKDFMATLRIYHNRKTTWRKEHQRKVPCASWCYFGKKSVANTIHKIWKRDLKRCWREELALAKYTELNNKLDLNYYYTMFESIGLFCLRNSVYRDIDHNTLFKHQTKGRID